MTRGLACLAALAAWLAIGCTDDVQLAHVKPRAEVNRDARVPSGGPSGAHCDDAPLSALAAAADAGPDTGCANLAAQTFRYALCACNDAALTAALVTDAFDSSRAAYVPGHDGASVGIDGQLLSAGAIDVAGSLTTAGSGELPITASPFRVAGNFAAGGDVIVSGVDAELDRDARIAGDLLVVGGSVRVARDLTTTPDHAGAEAAVVGGQTLSRAFDVPPPCACGDHEILDIAAAVDHAATENDDDALGLARDALYAGSGVLDLSCGRTFFQGGTLQGGLRVRVHGRSALFIDGDLTISGDFQPDFGADGELDVLVRGDLVLSAGIAIGSPDRPAALRFYVAGAGAIAAVGPLAFAANLYAPRAAWLTSSAQVLYGALFVDSYSAVGDQRLHYDRALLNVAAQEGCPPPPGMIACHDDADCAAPLLCIDALCRTGID